MQSAEEEEAFAQEESAEEEADSQEDSQEESSDQGISREFKEAMDSYEAFFDEYVEFMNKYAESDDALGMLADYSEYMTKYADTMEKMDAINSEELSAADYAYYIDVTARIQKKLLEVSY